eukprot:TRINITY_DN1081_c0_g1_i2.p1 TRINITY_DN1081_c0_g1~~TRINITY_DN1081_c0_g1_i2.p1  ORF type:complete len:299 (-),score=77.29 TRINITY_DN1081_c0_g1_i2:394-1290(-)
MLRAFLLISIALCSCHGAPLDNSEVELIDPVSSHDESEPGTSFLNVGRSPIFVIHGSFPQAFSGFGNAGGNLFPGLDNLGGTPFPRLGNPGASPFPFGDLFGAPFLGPQNTKGGQGNEDEDDIIEILPPSLEKTSGDVDNNEEDGPDNFCGFFCKIFADLDRQLSLLNHRNKGGDPTLTFFPGFASSDEGNTTYTEKVLPDGSIVRVNQTTFSDSDQDGNAYFFHTSTHVVGGSSDDKENEKDNEGKSPEGPTPANDNSKPVVQIIPEEEIGFKLPEDFDPNLNEVSEVGVDGGLLTQ